jgi:SAM-dependent methyltransferase
MTEQDLNLVPGKAHYAVSYVRGGRLFSYAHQMNAVLEHEPHKVLEVGPGPGMVTAALRAIDIEVLTVDVQAELRPDVVASVTDLPFQDRAFDVAMCCQVLEHLPFDRFVPALKEMGRVSRKAVVISLPDCTPYYEIRLRLPKLRNIFWTRSRQRDRDIAYKARKYEDDGHYWEVGYPEATLAVVEQAISTAGLRLNRSWRFIDNTYHRFFVVEPLP